jgi:hypothetical protein
MSTEDTIINIANKQKTESTLCEILLSMLGERAAQQDKYAIDLLREAQKTANEKETKKVL